MKAQAKTTYRQEPTGVSLWLDNELAGRLLALLLKSPGLGDNTNLDLVRAELEKSGVTATENYPFRIAPTYNPW